MLKQMLLALSVLALLPGAAAAAAWKLDPSTTVVADVGWHGQMVKVRFPSLNGQIDFDQNRPDQAKATIAVATGDATAGVAVVDALLRGGDYLDAQQFPQITFKLQKLMQTSKSTADVAGQITMRGVTKPVTFKATVFRFGPDANDPNRFEAGFDLTGSVDRTEFGSTGGLPDVAAVLPIEIHLLMTSK